MTTSDSPSAMPTSESNAGMAISESSVALAHGHDPASASEVEGGMELGHDPTPDCVVAVCCCSFCEDARKGDVDTKCLIDLENKLWRDRSDVRASRGKSCRNDDIEHRNEWSALQWAAAGGHDGVVRFILDADPNTDVMLSGGDGLTALHLAARGGHTDIVLALLNAGAKAHVNQQSGKFTRCTALHLASREGHVRVVQVLLSNDPKADVNAKDNCEETPLHLASKAGHVDVVEVLLSNDLKADVNSKGHSKRRPLHLASYAGHVDVVQVLLSNYPKAKVNAKDYYEKTPLHLASEGGHVDVVQVLLSNDSKAEVNAKDNYEETPLHLASKAGHVDVVEVLLSNDPKAEVNAKAEYGKTPLHLASEGGHVDVVQVLLSNDPKAEVNATDLIKETPLHLASAAGHVDVVQVLLSNDPKADVNAKDSMKGTPLHFASMNGHVDVVQALLSNDPKADVTAENNYGITPLHLAFERKYVKVVLLLINANPKPRLNKRCTYGETIMHYADDMHARYANSETQGIVEHIANIISKYIGEEDFKTAAQMAFESSEGPIWQQLIQKEPIKNYLEVLYRDRQAYVDAANAILVGAALIASVTFGSWLQPPLNYTIAGDVYTSSQSSWSIAPSSTYDPNYADLEHNMPLRVFWVFNCLSFYFAIATVVYGACSVLPRRRLFIQQMVIKLRRNLLVTSIFLGCSVLFVTIAFGIAGCIVLAPKMKFQLYMIVPTCIGGLVCLFSLCVLFKNIVEDLVR